MYAARIFVITLNFSFGATSFAADEASLIKLDNEFSRDIAPLIESYCTRCHRRESREAELDLTVYRKASEVIRSERIWETLQRRVAAGEMPPTDAMPQPTKEQRETIVDWIDRVRRFEAERSAGDPGVVLRVVLAMPSSTIAFVTSRVQIFDRPKHFRSIRPTKQALIIPASR